MEQEVPSTREQWQALLDEVRGDDPPADPADEKALTELEQRLDTQLPADYRNFLLVADGGDIGDLYGLYPAKEVGWARETMPGMIEAWEGFDAEIAMMKRCLAIGDDGANAYYFLDPADGAWTAIEWWTTPTEVTEYASFGALVKDITQPTD